MSLHFLLKRSIIKVQTDPKQTILITNVINGQAEM